MKRNAELNLTFQVYQSYKDLVRTAGNPVYGPGHCDLGDSLGAEG